MHGVILDSKTIGKGVNLETITDLLDSWDVFELTSRSETNQRISGADVVLTNKVRIDKSNLRSAKKLKFISVLATGTDHIDLKEACQSDVKVSNVRGWCTPSVTQHTVALLLSLTNKVSQYSADVCSGKWQSSDTFALLNYHTEEISGKTIGIFGFGELGQSFSNVMKSFGAKVLLGERKNLPPRAGRKSFEETLERSDFISLHCPLTQENFHMIDKMALKRMKSSAFLINTARGGLINSDHLLEALSSGEIAGAALDVLETEPPRNNEPLSTVKMPNLIISPHVAWSAIESRKRLVEQTHENIKSFLSGQPIRLVI